MKKAFHVLFCGLLLVGGVMQSLSAEDLIPMRGQYPPELPLAEKQTYKTVGDIELSAWIYRPDEEHFSGPRPAIVFFFGGGWRAGSPSQFQNQCRYLAQRGMVAITADYRVLSRHKASPFDCVADARSAIRWVRANAKQLNVDPEKIVAAGGSAGGHIACCTGVVPEPIGGDEVGSSFSSVPNAMALFNPAVMVAPLAGSDLLSEEKLKSITDRIPGDATLISPIHHVRSNLPPTIIFHGTDDTAVPFQTVEHFTTLMTKHGNRCELKAFPGEPHGFFNPRFRTPETKQRELHSYFKTMEQLDAFLVSLNYLTPSEFKVNGYKNTTKRGSLVNSWHQFTDRKQGHVAFLGGSITEMNGYRPMVEKFLQDQFPDTQFTFTNAGIASTCSTTGAFRLERDVLSQGPVDLLFVEFAVNDDQDAMHTPEECVRGMEGIMHQVRRHNPNADIVMTYFVNPGMLEQLQSGQTPLPMVEHEKVAAHYGVSTIHLAREVADQIDDENLTWKEFGGTHPAPRGNRIAADLIAYLLTNAWQNHADPAPHAPPEELLDPFSYIHAGFLDFDRASKRQGWEVKIPDWKSLPGSKRDRFTNIPMLCATEPGASFELTFEGTTAIAYVSAGPDAGMLEVSVDGGAPRKVQLYHRFSKGLHYPRSVELATELPSGKHTLKVTLSKESHPDSQGTAARIMNLGVN
ncbi:MAG: alpha/beta hydrolase fold domain-containing protein [Planctomycetaceae bacterium]|nr:alpha/beta hydrolase fold domain-containing protein [Planctomycetaceae bacterium]